jgi:hypothetical protein
MVAKAFALGEAAGPLTEVTGSTAHRTWRLDTFGAVYFVKHYDRPWDMPTWSDWMRAIQGSWEIERAAYEAGLPVAEPVLAPGAAWPWIDLDLGPRLATVRVHRWVQGTLRTDPATLPVAAQLGEFLGKVHRLLPPMHEWRRVPTWPQEWATVVPALDGPTAPWTRSLQAAVPVLDQASALCAEAAAETYPLVRTHRDLHSHNVIERPDGRVVVIDWDAASTQRSDWELVEAAFELAGYLSGPPSRPVVDTFVSTYRAAGGPKVPITASSFAGLLMCAQNWLHYNLRRVAGHYANGGTGGDGSAERDVVQSLAAVQRVMEGIEGWLPWFA